MPQKEKSSSSGGSSPYFEFGPADGAVVVGSGSLDTANEASGGSSDSGGSGGVKGASGGGSGEKSSDQQTPPQLHHRASTRGGGKYQKLPPISGVPSTSTPSFSTKDDDSSPRRGEFSIAVLEREEEWKYGWGKFTPRWLQWCCGPRFLLATLFVIALGQGFFIHGVVASSSTPLLRRYHFTMLDLGLIRMMYEVGLTLALLPVMYFNAQGVKRSFWLSAGCVLMAIGAFIGAVPHFIAGQYNYKQQTTTYNCDGDWTSMANEGDAVAAGSGIKSMLHVGDNPSLRNVSISLTSTMITIPTKSNEFPDNDCLDVQKFRPYVYIFMLSTFLTGIGAAFYYTMGIAYMDENIEHRRSVIYTGILSSALVFGVLLGFGFNHLILGSTYVDINNVHKIKNESAHWVGAWWIGMIVSSCIFLLPALAISGFPPRLPGSTKAHIHDAVDVDDDEDSSGRDKEFVQVAQTVWKSIKACFTNMTFLGLVLQQVAYFAVVNSFSSFIPIYMKWAFGTNAFGGRQAAMVLVSFALIGSILGTVFQDRFRLNVTGNLRFSLAAAVATLLVLAASFVRCENYKFAGVDHKYPVRNESKPVELPGGIYNLTATCNANCTECSYKDHEPICFKGGLRGKRESFIYFNPCFAGCQNGTKECKCIPLDPNIDFNDAEGGGNSMESSKCGQRKCTFRIIAFVLAYSWAALFVFARANPVQNCLLRCLPYKERVVGLALCAVVSRIFGAIPAPPFLGLLMWLSCSMWQKVCDNPFGHCVWRNQTRLVHLTGFSAYACGILETIGLSMAYYFHMKRQKKVELKKKNELYRRMHRSGGSRSGSGGSTTGTMSSSDSYDYEKVVPKRRYLGNDEVVVKGDFK